MAAALLPLFLKNTMSDLKANNKKEQPNG